MVLNFDGNPQVSNVKVYTLGGEKVFNENTSTEYFSTWAHTASGYLQRFCLSSVGPFTPLLQLAREHIVVRFPECDFDPMRSAQPSGPLQRFTLSDLQRNTFLPAGYSVNNATNAQGM